MFVPPRNPYLAREHALARQLRSFGMPIKPIAKYLGVSQSSVSVWVRDIDVPEILRARNRKRAGARRAAVWAQRHRSIRRAYQEGGRRRARRFEPLHFAGCMLYWAEGSKSKNTLTFCNSDPAMVKFFAEFLRKCFDLEREDFRFSLNVYLSGDASLEEIERYWCELLDLTPSQARKHLTNHFPTSSSGKKVNKLRYGVCSLSVNRSTWLVQHIYGAIQEYSGTDQPVWLDGPAPGGTPGPRL